MRVLCLPKYDRMGSSSRLRFFQYFDSLQARGVLLNVKPLLSNLYINKLYAGKKSGLIVVKGYFSRVMLLFKFKHYDIVWLEKEILPWIPAWFELFLIPKTTKLVVDYDDAIFHQYDQHKSSLIRWLLGQKISSVMRRANVVVCGNEYLAIYARKAGAKCVVIIPTVVDTERYFVGDKSENMQIYIGWIGAPSTAHFLKLIEKSLKKIVVCREVKIVAVGANEKQLAGLPIKSVVWTEKGEVEEIQKFDIGIMPLIDRAFERGKCGYKLIQCMACGIPVVASPVGVNSVIVREGVEGYLASSDEEWVSVLLKLIDSAELRKRMGESCRKKVVDNYSLDTAKIKLIQVFLELNTEISNHG